MNPNWKLNLLYIIKVIVLLEVTFISDSHYHTGMRDCKWIRTICPLFISINIMLLLNMILTAAIYQSVLWLRQQLVPRILEKFKDKSISLTPHYVEFLNLYNTESQYSDHVSRFNTLLREQVIICARPWSQVYWQPVTLWKGNEAPLEWK